MGTEFFPCHPIGCVPMLVADGHDQWLADDSRRSYYENTHARCAPWQHDEVWATTTSDTKVDDLAAAGAKPVVLDVLEADFISVVEGLVFDHLAAARRRGRVVGVVPTGS